MIGPREEFIEVNGARLALVRYGDPSGPPVLCLHGWLDNAASFSPLSARLGQFELLALELAGHGHSGHRPPGVAYHQVDWVRDVFAAADVLGLERFALLGHSMGAGIAALAAGTLPERISRLVMIEGLGPRAVDPDGVPAALAAQIGAEKAFARRQLRNRPGRFETALRARLAASPLLPESAELLTRRGTRARDGGYEWVNDRRLHHLQPYTLEERQVRSFFARIECPSLLVWASDGLHAERARVQERVECFRDLQVAAVPGRHHVHMDDPMSVALEVAPFLEPLLG